MLPTESQIRVNTSSDLNVNVSTANMNLFLEAYASWTNLSRIEEGSKQQLIQACMQFFFAYIFSSISAMLSGGVLDPPPGRNGFLVFLQDRVSEHKSWEEDLRVWVSAFFSSFFSPFMSNFKD